MKKKGDLLSGVFGPFKFSVRNGVQIVSKAVAPGTMKQSKATKKASKVFGKASALSKELRLSLATPYPGLFSNKAINDLNGQMYSILKDCHDPETDEYHFERGSFERLEQLEFNLKSKVSKLMSLKPVVSLEGDQLTLALPEQRIPQDFKFPKESFKCDITVGLSLFRLTERVKVRKAELQSITVMKDAKIIAPQSFQFKVPAGCLCVLTIFLNYSAAHEGGWMLLKDKKFSPAAICGAVVTPGTYQKEGDTRRWTEMDKVKF